MATGTGAAAGSTTSELGALGAGIDEASESELPGRLEAFFSVPLLALAAAAPTAAPATPAAAAFDSLLVADGTGGAGSEVPGPGAGAGAEEVVVTGETEDMTSAWSPEVEGRFAETGDGASACVPKGLTGSPKGSRILTLDWGV